MANGGNSGACARRAATLASEIEACTCLLVLPQGLAGPVAHRVTRAARAVARCLAVGGRAGKCDVDYASAGRATGELVSALHALAEVHDCHSARRQARLAGMLHVVVAELGLAADGQSNGDAIIRCASP